MLLIPNFLFSPQTLHVYSHYCQQNCSVFRVKQINKKEMNHLNLSICERPKSKWTQLKVCLSVIGVTGTVDSIVGKCLSFHAHCRPLSSHIKITIVIILYSDNLETNNFHKYSHSREFRFTISIIIQAVVCLKSRGYLHAELRVERGASISKSSPLLCAAAVCQDTRVLPTSSRTKKNPCRSGM